MVIRVCEKVQYLKDNTYNLICVNNILERTATSFHALIQTLIFTQLLYYPPNGRQHRYEHWWVPGTPVIAQKSVKIWPICPKFRLYCAMGGQEDLARKIKYCFHMTFEEKVTMTMRVEDIFRRMDVPGDLTKTDHRMQASFCQQGYRNEISVEVVPHATVMSARRFIPYRSYNLPLPTFHYFFYIAVGLYLSTSSFSSMMHIIVSFFCTLQFKCSQ